MNFCWARDPVQPELIQAMITQNSLNKFLSLAMKYVHAIPVLITRGSLWIQKCKRSVDGCCESNWQNNYSRFAYRKRGDKAMIKQKSYEEVLKISWKNLNWASYTEAMHTFWTGCYKIGCMLFNTIFMTLHDRMKNKEFEYAFVGYPSLARKIWAMENDWEALLI